MKKATTSLFLDRYHPQQNSKCRIKLCVTHNRQRKYYQTKYSLTVDEFESVMGNPRKEDFKNIRRELNSMEVKANDVIQKMTFFDWKLFDKRFTDDRNVGTEVNAAYEAYVSDLEREGQISTASTYNCAKRSLNAFASNLLFIDVTPEFLKKYEKWMIAEGNSPTTISIYLRTLRTLINKGIAEGDIVKESYPFGKRRYEMPKSRNTKKALRLDEIARIFKYEAQPGTTREMAKDFWIFIYLCNGLNVKDLCRLQYKNIEGDILSFNRAKTSSTNRENDLIRLKLSEHAKNIIERWGQEKKGPETYIFPVLYKGVTPKKERDLVQLKTHLINEHMKKIAEELEIDKPATTYYARHSFATVLKRSGKSYEKISEALGHKSLKTTMNYLDGFEDDTLDDISKALTAFS